MCTRFLNFSILKTYLGKGLLKEYDEFLLKNQEENEDLGLTMGFKAKFEDLNEIPRIVHKSSKETLNESDIPFNAQETCIVLQFNHDKAHTYPIPTAGAKFGRSPDMDIVLSDTDISRKHAEIFFLDNRFYLKDLKSSIGTWIRVRDPILLEKNMKFDIGKCYMLRIEDVKQLKVSLRVEENEEDCENEKAQELDFGKIGVKKGVTVGKGAECFIKLQSKKNSGVEDKHCMIYRDENDQIMLADSSSESG